MLFANILLGITAFVTMILGGLIMLSNSKRGVNRLLTFYIVAVFLWLTTNLATNLAATAELSLVFARSTLIGAALIPYSFLLFVTAYLYQQLKPGLVLAWGVIPFLILLTTPTSLNIVSIDAYGLNTKAGQVYALLVIEFLVYFVTGCVWLVRARRSNKTNSIQRAQISYILAGVAASVVPGLATNGLLPALGYGDAVFFGPATTIFLSVFTTIAIVRHGFLDIRLIVARSLGYLLTLVTLVGVYVLMIFGVSSSFLGTGNLTGVQQTLYIVATLVFGFSLSPLKRFFDRLTNKLFYRDAYDAQVLLDKLNKVLVGNIDLDIILKQTSDLVATTLKAEYVAFIIRETEGTSRRASFSKLVNLNADDILALKAQKKGKTELFVADEIENDRDKQKEVMNANNIAIAAHLAGSGGSGNTGYLLLGPKQSGNPYNKQDLQVLDIIANELVIAIQNALRFEEIETFNITLQEKVDEATRQLRRTNEKLKEIDETKDEFISMASHQLRTPLTSVKGYVSMVVEGDAGKITKQQKELLDQAFASSQRMVYLIADLLNVSRLKTGKFVIENKPTPLADVIETEMQQLQDMANTKDQTLTYVKPKDFPDLNLDETKIRQVIMNFTDNALHYTPAGGHISVNLEEKADSIEFTVVDDGLGVPKAEQHHLFGKFYRAGNAKKARPDGTGLGLFMAKKVIVAQGGAVIFKSEEGKGSTFGFTFPKKTVLTKK